MNYDSMSATIILNRGQRVLDYGCIIIQTKTLLIHMQGSLQFWFSLRKYRECTTWPKMRRWMHGQPLLHLPYSILNHIYRYLSKRTVKCILSIELK